MTDPTPGPAPEVSYALDYDLFASGTYNLDFKGPGLLTIRADGPTYTFSGRPRRWFARKTTELVFHPGNIVNVAVNGRTVRFKTPLGNSGKQHGLFAFHLRDAAEAQAVAALLPATVDLEFTETSDFNARLDEVAGRPNPWTSATNLIVALNVAGYVAMGLLGAGWFTTESLMPYVIYGANNGAATTDGEWWRLLTSMFMHYGIMHLLLNMWALFQAGHFMEKLLGRTSYALAYLACGIAGGFASIAWHGDKSWSAGASGAVFGVYGLLLGYMLRQKQALPASIYQSMMKSTLSFAGYNILYGLARSGIDNAAHIGGLVAGIGFGWLLALPLDAAVRARETGRRLQLGLAALAGLVVVGVAATPRFDYSVRESFAWEEINTPQGRRETDLLKQHEEFLKNVAKPGEAERYAAWLSATLIPFYEDWGRQLRAMELAPDKSAGRARRSMLEIFDHRIQSYRHLITGLQTRDRQAVARYQQEDAQVVQEITQLAGARKK